MRGGSVQGLAPGLSNTPFLSRILAGSVLATALRAPGSTTGSKRPDSPELTRELLSPMLAVARSSLRAASRTAAASSAGLRGLAAGEPGAQDARSPCRWPSRWPLLGGGVQRGSSLRWGARPCRHLQSGGAEHRRGLPEGAQGPDGWAGRGRAGGEARLLSAATVAGAAGTSLAWALAGELLRGGGPARRTCPAA